MVPAGQPANWPHGFKQHIKKTAAWAKTNGYGANDWWPGREMGLCRRGRKSGMKKGVDFAAAGETLKEDPTQVLERLKVREELAVTEMQEAKEEVQKMKIVQDDHADLKRKHEQLKAEHKNLRDFTKLWEEKGNAKFKYLVDAHTDLREQHNLAPKEYGRLSPFKESYKKFKAAQEADSDEEY